MARQYPGAVMRRRLRWPTASRFSLLLAALLMLAMMAADLTIPLARESNPILPSLSYLPDLYLLPLAPSHDACQE